MALNNDLLTTVQHMAQGTTDPNSTLSMITAFLRANNVPEADIPSYISKTALMNVTPGAASQLANTPAAQMPSSSPMGSLGNVLPAVTEAPRAIQMGRKVMTGTSAKTPAPSTTASASTSAPSTAPTASDLSPFSNATVPMSGGSFFPNAANTGATASPFGITPSNDVLNTFSPTSSAFDPFSQHLVSEPGNPFNPFGADPQAPAPSTPTAAAAPKGSGGLAGFMQSHPTLTSIAGAVGAAALGYSLYNQVNAMVENPNPGNVMGTLLTGGGLVLALMAAPIITTTVFGFIGGLLGVMGIHAMGFLGPLMGTPLGAAVMAGIVVAVMIITALLGGKTEEAKETATGTAVDQFTGQLPNWYDTLPSSAVMFLVGGLSLASAGVSLSPNALYQNFSVPTVQLTDALNSAAGQSIGNIYNQIYVSKNAGPNASDRVYVVTPGSNGNSNMVTFNLDHGGYLIGPNGPMTNYKPIFTPVVTNGKVTGVKQNNDALNALIAQNAALAIANNPNATPEQRQAAMTYAGATNKGVIQQQ